MDTLYNSAHHFIMRQGQVMWHKGEPAIIIEIFPEDETAIVSINGNFKYSIPVSELTAREH